MTIETLRAEWLFIAGAAMGIATVLVSLVYMLSELLMNDKMKIWAKMELVEIFYSAVIISLMIVGLQTIDMVVQGALVGTDGAPMTTAYILTKDVEGGGQGYEPYDICDDLIAQHPDSVYHGINSCHMRLAIWYLREVFNEAKDFAFDIYLSYIFTSMVAEFTINIEYLFHKPGFFTFNPWRGFFTMGNTIKSLVFSWAIKIMMITKFQEIMLSFIAKALFPALFVSGAILRTFAFTRRLGGLLLAMGIALYFIFPAFYAFGALVMLNIKNDEAVQLAWKSPTNPVNPGNRDINPMKGPDDYPNPNIANTMYIKKGATFAMVGGSGQFDVTEALRKKEEYETKKTDDFLEEMENKGEGTVYFDMSNDEKPTDEEKEAAYEKAYEDGFSWFSLVSGQGKFDHFVGSAWKEGGPIDILSRLTFWSVFFALFGIIGTIAGIRSLSITFGGDIEIAGLTRLI